MARIFHLRPARRGSASCYKFSRVFSPLLKPPESDSPPDGLLSVSTTNSPGGENPTLPKLREKSPCVTILVLSSCAAVSPPPLPLGVLFHVVQVGSHDEVFGVQEAVLVCVLLPACVVALVGDVAFASPRLKLPEVQPRLVVLRERDMDGKLVQKIDLLTEEVFLILSV